MTKRPAGWRLVGLPLALLLWVGQGPNTLIGMLHAAGHAVAARLLGIPVVRSLGTGPALWRSRGGGWAASLLPGAYCHAEHEQLDELPVGRLMAYLAAGPAVNLVLMVTVPVLLMTAAAMLGEEETAPLVSSVVAGSAADEAGMLPDDRIVAVNGIEVLTWQETNAELGRAQPATLTLEQGGRLVQVELPHPVAHLQAAGVLYWRQAPAVTLLDPQGSAARSGMQAGDRVAAVDGQPVQHWDQLEELLCDGTAHSLELESGDQIDIEPANSPEALGLAPLELQIARVSPGSPGDRAGLRAGDVMRSVGGVPLSSFDQLRAAVTGAPLELGVQRGSERFTVSLQPEPSFDGRHLIGVERPELSTVQGPKVVLRHEPMQALVRGVEDSLALVAFTTQKYGELLVGRAAPKQSLGGPVEIVRYTQTAASSERPGSRLLRLVGMIVLAMNLPLVLYNLLPVPWSDTTAALNQLARRRLGKGMPRKVENRIGIAVIALLFAVVVVGDLLRLLGG